MKVTIQIKQMIYKVYFISGSLTHLCSQAVGIYNIILYKLNGSISRPFNYERYNI